MQRHRLVLLSAVILAFSCGISSASTLASTAFSISATNVTMPSSGAAATQFTITSIPMTGTISITCTYAGKTTEAKVPSCPNTPPHLYTVTAGGTLTGVVEFYPYGSAVPAALALTGGLIIGLGKWRRVGRGFARAVFAVGTLTILAGIGACGGNPNAMTSGAYPYTISADNESGSPTPLGQAVSTTINVTVP